MNKPNLKKSDRILSISHNDPDGVGCQIVLHNVFKNIHFNNISNYKVDQTLKNVNYDDFDWVFLTDLHPKDPELLNLSDKIIMIDHHKSAVKMHNPEKFKYVKIGTCGAKLTKSFIESIFNVKLSHLDNLFYLINDYDIYTLKNFKSIPMYDVMFNLYLPRETREQFYSGRTRFNMKELGWLRNRQKDLNEVLENLEVFEIESIKGAVIIQKDYMNEIATYLLKRDYNIVFIRNPTTERCSIRHNLEWFDCGNYLDTMKWGGGHKLSAGFFAENDTDFMNKLEVIEKYLLENKQV